MLWNCLGGGSHELKPEVYKATLTLGDTLLVCSDGLTGRVRDEDIIEHLQRDSSAEETCRSLVSAANTAGGSDNITVVVARFRHQRQEESQAHKEKAALDENIDETKIMATAAG